MAVTLYGDRNFADVFKDLNMRRVSWIIEWAQFKHLRCTANTYWVIKGGDPFLVVARGMPLMKMSPMVREMQTCCFED